MVLSIPAPIVQAIESHTGSRIKAFSFSGGGCINKAGKVASDDAVYFLKWNDLEKFPRMFEVEAKGLAMLRKTESLPAPGVILTATAGSFQFLLLEWVEVGSKGMNYWKDFGSGLATLHQTTAKHFGLDHNNYIGSLPQYNDESNSWVEFFVEQRLKRQLKMALEAGRVQTGTSKKFDTLFGKLPSLLVEEKSSLLHGDLWGGNILTTSEGRPLLIDPAVYYGHREVDLGMTQLFGGFDPDFFGSYNEVYPLQAGYSDRFDLYNLYPLMVHVNLFGGGYLQQVMSVLKRFV